MSTNINRGNPTSFQLIFPVLPIETDVDAHKEFRLNLTDTVIPSIALGDLELPFRGGQSYMEGGGIEFGEWTANFLIDSEFKSWITIVKWIFAINNNRDNTGGWPDYSYSCDAFLEVFDNFENKILTLKFEYVWPNNIGEVVMDYQDSNPVIKCPVGLVYDRYYYVSDT